jgi:hypothetical protein
MRKEQKVIWKNQTGRIKGKIFSKKYRVWLDKPTSLYIKNKEGKSETIQEVLAYEWELISF